MVADFRFPHTDAVRTVLAKAGVDPDSRMDRFDQDVEYTTCRVDELATYVAIYDRLDTSDQEKLVLGCFFMECLNDVLCQDETPHPLQGSILHRMARHPEIHRCELLYRMAKADDEEEEDSWAVRPFLVERFPELVSVDDESSTTSS